MVKKATLEEFIQKAYKIHGNKYDYSKVVYINSWTKITIICPIHGEFEQTPSSHIQGTGCPSCGLIKTLKITRHTLEEFIQKAIQIHGIFYDYSNFIYFNNWTRGIIICPIHGEFEQTPSNHLNSKGCPKCGYDRVSEFRKITQEEVINRFKEIHGERYGYNNFIYKGSHNKSVINCSDHGDFLQSYSNHVKGHGCPDCGLIKTLETTRLTLEDFIIKAIEIHGSKYNYQDFIYSSTHNKGNIKCNICGYIFEQTPSAHIHQKQGCPRCKKSKGELRLIEILDKHNIDFKDEYKLPEVADNYRYDFYLPDYQILIEFHGKQHYKHIPFFHKTEDEFIARKNTDDVKKYSARMFKYKLLEFNYKQLKHMSKKQFEELVLTTINSLI